MSKHTTRRAPYQYGATLEQLFRSRFTPLGFDQCWEWHGYINATGYGKITHKGRTYRAHRLAWKFHHGREIPDGMVVCHTCDNRRCVNPYHLALGTQTDNMTDKTHKGRQHRGEVHPHAKLTADKVRKIRSLHKQGIPPREIAKRVGATKSAIGHVLKGNSWRHVA